MQRHLRSPPLRRPKTDPHSEPTGRCFTARHWWLLLLLAVLGAALRLHELGTWSFWVDEAHTWRDATMQLHGERGFLREDRALYPLTFLWLRELLALGWIGNDEWSLRLPFALVGIATVPLLAVCGRRFVGADAAVLAAWFCAINPWHVFWSQNARGYVLVFLFAAVAANRAHRWAESDRVRDLLAAVAAIFVATLSHPTGAFPAVGLAAFAWLRGQRIVRGRALVGIVLLLAAVAVVLPLVVIRLAPYQDFFQAKPDASLLHFAQTAAYYFRPLLLVCAVAGLLRLRAEAGRSTSLLAGCLCLAPFFVPALLGSTVVKATARYAISALPVLLWLSASAATWSLLPASPRGTPRTIGMRLAPCMLAAMLTADAAVQLHQYYGLQQGQRAQWRQACEFVQQRAAGGKLRALTVNWPTALYYLRRDHWSAGLEDPYPAVQVHALTKWGWEGVTERGVVLHPPGGRHHLAWHGERAQQDGALLAVLLTRPELDEMDHDSSLWVTLQQEFDLVLHLPCWVGPKDESVYVFVPRR